MLYEVPLWVWGILVYLIVVGILAMRPRVLPLQSLFVAPIIFTLGKYKTLYLFWYLYIPCMFVSAVFGFYIASYEAFSVNVLQKSVQLPASYTLLPLFLSFFVIKFALGYCMQTHMASLTLCEKIDIVISALFSGYLLGKALYVIYYYKKKQG